MLGSSLAQLLMLSELLKQLCSAGASLPGDKAAANESQQPTLARAKQESGHNETRGTQEDGRAAA